MQRAVTMLDIRLGLFRWSPEQQEHIDKHVLPLLARVAEEELARQAAEQAQRRPKAAGE